MNSSNVVFWALTISTVTFQTVQLLYRVDLRLHSLKNSLVYYEQVYSVERSRDKPEMTLHADL